MRYAPGMRVLLNAVCGVTIAASIWLGVMFVVLHRPGFARGALTALLFVVQSLLAIAVANGWLAGLVWRALSLVGAAGLLWFGVRTIAANLSSNHFEGFALIIGILLIGQALTTALLSKSAPIRQLT